MFWFVHLIFIQFFYHSIASKPLEDRHHHRKVILFAFNIERIIKIGKVFYFLIQYEENEIENRLRYLGKVFPLSV
ncbi:hypothetical protein JTB14_020173 [Gonioctena quinquepunctata]|nr:hypothetical protein JTB14_020173 [Gonioctena quinquepunctata]